MRTITIIVLIQTLANTFCCTNIIKPRISAGIKKINMSSNNFWKLGVTDLVRKICFLFKNIHCAKIRFTINWNQLQHFIKLIFKLVFVLDQRKQCFNFWVFIANKYLFLPNFVRLHVTINFMLYLIVKKHCCYHIFQVLPCLMCHP